MSDKTKPALSRQRSSGLDITVARHAGIREFHLTLRPLPGEKTADTVRRLASILKEHEAVVVRHELFGTVAVQSETMNALRQVLGPVDWPITGVQGAGCAGELLAGMHVLAVAGVPVETVSWRGRPTGRVYGDGATRHLVLGDLRPDDYSDTKTEQARQLYENLRSALREGGMDMPNLARTWLFLDDILSWYGPFNEVRTAFYKQHQVFDRVVPASTGVSGVNVFGGGMVAGAWAAQSLDGTHAFEEVNSPKQCPAPCYGSSFSRAVEISDPSVRRLMVSGTASIEPGGASVCGNDVEAQIDLTMEVVRAILVSRGLDYPDVSRATAYFKRAKDASSFRDWQSRNGAEDWPVVCANVDICRDELLFELELDALGLKDPRG